MSATPQLLSSWKEIAQYFGKGVRTVQRWESEFGLPVHRPNLRAKGIVRASTDELKNWLAASWSQRQVLRHGELRASLEDHRRLQREQRELIHGLRKAMHDLRATSRMVGATVSGSGENLAKKLAEDDEAPLRVV